MEKHCNDCARYGADDCPNSKECYSTEDKPYFTKKAMKPIYIFGRKRIRELEEELEIKKEMISVRQDVISQQKKKIAESLSYLEEAAKSILILLKENIELNEQLSKFPSRDAKGRFTKRK